MFLAEHVVVENGTATLRGRLRSHRQKLAAIDCLLRITGVKGIKDQLAVDPIRELSDFDLAKRVNLMLAYHADTADEAIVVRARKGRCTLLGNVRSLDRWILAQDLALSCDGVCSVRNLLLVDPRRRMSDAIIADRTRRLFADTGNDELSSIRITCTSGTVGLSGRVRNYRMIIEALKLVQTVCGVREVKNRLRT